MSNIIPLEFPEDMIIESERKMKNDDIVYKLYKKGVTRHNPYAYEIENNKDSVINVPRSCFVMGKFFKVGD